MGYLDEGRNRNIKEQVVLDGRDCEGRMFISGGDMEMSGLGSVRKTTENISEDGARG